MTTVMTESHSIRPVFLERYHDPGKARDYDHDRFGGEPNKQQRDRNTIRAILTTLKRLDGVSSVLDLPCGTGRLSKLLIDKSYDYTGVDQAEAMLDVAREKCVDEPKARFVAADARDLQFDDDSFDCVVCVRFLNLIESFDERVPMLREMRRVSRRYLLVESRYLRELAWWRPLMLWKPKAALRLGEDKAFWADMDASGWRLDFLHHYRSRGLLSTTRIIAVFTKD